MGQKRVQNKLVLHVLRRRPGSGREIVLAVHPRPLLSVAARTSRLAVHLHG